MAAEVVSKAVGEMDMGLMNLFRRKTKLMNCLKAKQLVGRNQRRCTNETRKYAA